VRLVPREPRSPPPAWLHSGDMADPLFDAVERARLSGLFDELGPKAPTLLAPWTTRDLAAHLVLRKRDYLAGPGLVLPGAWGRLAERRQGALALTDFTRLIAAIRSGPPPGFFRIGWVRRLPSLNEFFVHHEDVRRANGRGPRTNEQAMDEALWRNVSRAPWFLARRLRGAGLELQWAGTAKTVRARRGTGCPHRRASRRAAALPLRPAGRGTGRGERACCGGRSRATRTVRHVTEVTRFSSRTDTPSRPIRSPQVSRTHLCVQRHATQPSPIRTSGHSHPRHATLKSP
jgi:uncharacterized protein (TIGR03085 family)